MNKDITWHYPPNEMPPKDTDPPHYYNGMAVSVPVLCYPASKDTQIRMGRYLFDSKTWVLSGAIGEFRKDAIKAFAVINEP